jgi:hypothetical protein
LDEVISKFDISTMEMKMVDWKEVYIPQNGPETLQYNHNPFSLSLDALLSGISSTTDTTESNTPPPSPKCT